MLHLIKKDLVMHKLAWFTFLAMLIFFLCFLIKIKFLLSH